MRLPVLEVVEDRSVVEVDRDDSAGGYRQVQVVDHVERCCDFDCGQRSKARMRRARAPATRFARELGAVEYFARDERVDEYRAIAAGELVSQRGQGRVRDGSRQRQHLLERVWVGPEFHEPAFAAKAEAIAEVARVLLKERDEDLSDLLQVGPQGFAQGSDVEQRMVAHEMGR